MALLPILQFPDPRLKLVAKPVAAFGEEITKIYNNLLETMYEHDGIGLAATQTNIQLRIFVMDLSEDQSQAKCFINPEIISASGELVQEEGCLSFPNVFAKVKRYANITVKFYNLDGEQQTLTVEDLDSICIQHEMDHLDGVTFFDHLSPLKQKMIRKKLEKQYDKTL